jgi:hypothetical protein
MAIPFKKAILPNENFVSVRIFLEFPEMLTWNDRRKWYMQPEEKNSEFITLCVGTGVTCKLGISSPNGFYLSHPLSIKSRSEKEMAAIKKWHSRFGNFLSETERVYENGTYDWDEDVPPWKHVPTVKDFRNFESQLSDGTLKNLITFRRLLASIPADKLPTNKSRPPKLPTLEITEPYRNLGNYLDALHPIEREHRIIEAIDYFREENIGKAFNPNYLRMIYLLIPKLPKAEREKYLRNVNNKEYKNILQNSPEPVNTIDQNLPSSVLSTTSTTSSTTLPLPSSTSSVSEPQTDLTNLSTTQPNETPTPTLTLRLAAVVVILFVVLIAGIIFVRKIVYK